jgi:hypothetical protein
LASDEVNAYFDGSDGSVGTTKVTTDEINSLGNPDVIKGEIIDAIEKGFDNLGKKTGKEMSQDQVLKEIDGGKVLMVKTGDGKEYYKTVYINLYGSGGLGTKIRNTIG